MYYIGVDLGGTNIAVGIVDESCKIVKKASVPTKPERGADAVVADMATVAKNLLMELNIPMSRLQAQELQLPEPPTRIAESLYTATTSPSQTIRSLTSFPLFSAESPLT